MKIEKLKNLSSFINTYWVFRLSENIIQFGLEIKINELRF